MNNHIHITDDELKSLASQHETVDAFVNSARGMEVVSCDHCLDMLSALNETQPPKMSEYEVDELLDIFGGYLAQRRKPGEALEDLLDRLSNESLEEASKHPAYQDMIAPNSNVIDLINSKDIRNKPDNQPARLAASGGSSTVETSQSESLLKNKYEPTLLRRTSNHEWAGDSQGFMLVRSLSPEDLSVYTLHVGNKTYSLKPSISFLGWYNIERFSYYEFMELFDAHDKISSQMYLKNPKV